MLTLARLAARRKVNVAAIFVLLLLVLGLPSEAKGYTDPGTGALLWQSLLAIAATGVFYFRRVLMFWRRKDGAGN